NSFVYSAFAALHRTRFDPARDGGENLGRTFALKAANPAHVRSLELLRHPLQHSGPVQASAFARAAAGAARRAIARRTREAHQLGLFPSEPHNFALGGANLVAQANQQTASLLLQLSQSRGKITS